MAHNSEIRKSRRQHLSELTKSKVLRLHARLNHRNFGSIASMIRNGVLLNIEAEGISARDVETLASHNDCYPCAIAKWKKQGHKIGSGIRPSRPGQSWSFDYQGPYDPATPDGCTGMITFICLATLYGMVFIVRHKTEAAECVRLVRLKCSQHGHSMESVR